MSVKGAFAHVFFNWLLFCYLEQGFQKSYEMLNLIAKPIQILFHNLEALLWVK